MLKLRPVMVLLAFALLIQNTCPMGAAGKSMLVSSCGHCPMKHQGSISPEGQKKLIVYPPIHFPLYIFSVPNNTHTFQLEHTVFTRPLLANGYVDASPGRLLRPPRS